MSPWKAVAARQDNAEKVVNKETDDEKVPNEVAEQANESEISPIPLKKL